MIGYFHLHHPESTGWTPITYGQVGQVDASHRHASYIHYTAGQTGAAEIGVCTLSSGQEI